MNNPFMKNDVYFKTNEEFQRPLTGVEIAKKGGKILKKSWSKFNYVFIFIVILLIYVFSSLDALTWNSITTIFYSSVTVGVVAIGMGLIIITGEIDLSVGSNFAFTAGIGVLTYNTLLPKLGGEMPALLVTLLICLLVGAALGFINGFLIGKLQMPSFIVTLATMLTFRSIIQYILSIQPNKPSSFRINGYGGETDLFNKFTNAQVGGISVVAIIFVIIGILVWLLAKYTKFGRKVYAVGSNPKAAVLVGINAGWTKTIVFTIAGALVGAGAFLQICMRGSIDAATVGKSYELYAIAAVVLGGISMKGGRGSLIGVIFGTIAFMTIDKVIAALNLNGNLNDTIKGVILLVAVALQVLKFSKQDFYHFLERYNIKFNPNYDKVIESQKKQKVNTLEKKAYKKANKINNNSKLSDLEVEKEIDKVFDELDLKVLEINKNYDNKIVVAKLKIFQKSDSLLKKEYEDKSKEQLLNQKLYDQYLIKNFKNKVAPKVAPALEFVGNTNASYLDFEHNVKLSVINNNQNFTNLLSEIDSLSKDNLPEKDALKAKETINKTIASEEEEKAKEESSYNEKKEEINKNLKEEIAKEAKLDESRNKTKKEENSKKVKTKKSKPKKEENTNDEHKRQRLEKILNKRKEKNNFYEKI